MKVQCGCRSDFFGRLTVALHIGFLYLEETQEMLERLRGEPQQAPKLPGTSKVFSTQVKPRPIDRTAARGMAEGGA